MHTFPLHHKLTTLLCIGVGVMAYLPAMAASPDTALLSKGGVVVQEELAADTLKSGPSRVQAKILIPHPPERVWQVVSDPQDVVREEHKVKRVQTLSKAGNTQEVQYTVLYNALLPTFQYVLRLENTKPQLIRFQRVSGSFKDFEGSWKLTPVDNGQKTLLTYTLALDPGMFFPRFLVLQAIKSDLPFMMQNVKKRINERFTGSF